MTPITIIRRIPMTITMMMKVTIFTNRIIKRRRMIVILSRIIVKMRILSIIYNNKYDNVNKDNDNN